MDRSQTDLSSFRAFVDRRFKFAGRALIEGGHPWFTPTDLLQEQSAGFPDGFVSFANYDYLGLASDPRVHAAAKDAIDRFGTSVGASRLVGGERLAHGELEKELTEFLGVGSVLSLISGYLTNTSLVSHIMGARDLVITDALAHNSLEMAARSGRYAHKTFKHNDLEDLHRLLSETRKDYSNVLIAVDGLYSMDGDITDLPRLLEIKEEFGTWLLLDEAHSYGVLGATGRGLCEHFDIDPSRIELQVGTLSKTFVSSGGFIAATEEVIEWLRFTLPGFVYSVGLSPASVASAKTALDILRNEPGRICRLRENSMRFLTQARAAGLNTGNAIGIGVVPLLFDTPGQTLIISSILQEQGIFAPPVVHVGVPKDAPRIRFFITAGHTERQIDRVVAAVAAAADETSARSSG